MQQGWQQGKIALSVDLIFLKVQNSVTSVAIRNN
jgi:hypothetical protein